MNTFYAKEKNATFYEVTPVVRDESNESLGHSLLLENFLFGGNIGHRERTDDLETDLEFWENPIHSRKFYGNIGKRVLLAHFRTILAQEGYDIGAYLGGGGSKTVFEAWRIGNPGEKYVLKYSQGVGHLNEIRNARRMRQELGSDVADRIVMPTTWSRQITLEDRNTNAWSWLPGRLRGAMGQPKAKFTMEIMPRATTCPNQWDPDQKWTKLMEDLRLRIKKTHWYHRDDAGVRQIGIAPGTDYAVWVDVDIHHRQACKSCDAIPGIEKCRPRCTGYRC